MKESLCLLGDINVDPNVPQPEDGCFWFVEVLMNFVLLSPFDRGAVA